MDKRSKKLKVGLVALGVLVLFIVFCVTQLYTIKLEGPAYEGEHLGLRPARKGDLALVWTHLFRKSIHAGDLVLLTSPGRKGREVFVRRIYQAPDARTGQFSWVEYRAESDEPMIYDPGGSARICGRVVCLIRVP